MPPVPQVIDEDFQVFIPFAKRDDDAKKQNMVFGFASTELEDSDGEIIDKEAVQEAWPAYAKFGNIREMHQAIASGKLKSTIWKEGSPYIGVKVVGAEAREKVDEGVYNGFSLGGKKIEKVGNHITKLRISEISLVDRPANPGAVFDVFKADKNGFENELMKQTENFEIQTLLFDKGKFTSAEALAWAKEHNFKADKVDTDENFRRVRQFDPDLCIKGTFRQWDIDKDKGIHAGSCGMKKVGKAEGGEFEMAPPLKGLIEAMAEMPAFEKGEGLKKNFGTIQDLIQILRTLIFNTNEVANEEGKAGYPGIGTTDHFLATVTNVADLAVKYAVAQITAAMELLPPPSEAHDRPEDGNLLLSDAEVKGAMEGLHDLEKVGAKFSRESVQILSEVMGRIKQLVRQNKKGKKKMAKTFTDADKKAIKTFRGLGDEDREKLKKEDPDKFKQLSEDSKVLADAEKAEGGEALQKVEGLTKERDEAVKKFDDAVKGKDEALKKLEDETKGKDEAVKKAEGLETDLKKSQDDLKKVQGELKASGEENAALKKQVAKPLTGAEGVSFIGKDNDSGNKEIDSLAKQQIVAQTKGDMDTIIKMSLNNTLRKDLEGKKYSEDEMKKLEKEGDL